jgi:hypothetical protein
MRYWFEVGAIEVIPGIIQWWACPYEQQRVRPRFTAGLVLSAVL